MESHSNQPFAGAGNSAEGPAARPQQPDVAPAGAVFGANGMVAPTKSPVERPQTGYGPRPIAVNREGGVIDAWYDPVSPAADEVSTEAASRQLQEAASLPLPTLIVPAGGVITAPEQQPGQPVHDLPIDLSPRQ